MDKMHDNDFFEPGMLVRHPKHPEWGVGQVQSNVSGRVTVMFSNAGKIVVHSEHVALEFASN